MTPPLPPVSVTPPIIAAAIDQSWRLILVPVPKTAKPTCTSQTQPARPASIPQTAYAETATA